MIRHFRDLEIYQIGYKLALEIAKLLGDPKRYYELCSQVRRSSQSIPANIAEGFGRNSSKKDFAHFLKIALGSANETLVHLDFLKDLEMIPSQEYEYFSKNYEILARKMNVLIQKVSKNQQPIPNNQQPVSGGRLSNTLEPTPNSGITPRNRS
ncbi:four helix bundle protein [Candidatus Peregrinibacteria bacterium]|nr:four helix bundle protein [Candidatus Peregrinibacteria bacterium]